jgi:hypothetical protein
VLLPDSETVRKQFGTIAYSNGKDDARPGERPYALASTLYDLCNHVAVDALLDRADAYEVDLAVAHLDHPQIRATWCWPTATTRPSACSPS